MASYGHCDKIIEEAKDADQNVKGGLLLELRVERCVLAMCPDSPSIRARALGGEGTWLPLGEDHGERTWQATTLPPSSNDPPLTLAITKSS